MYRSVDQGAHIRQICAIDICVDAERSAMHWRRGATIASAWVPFDKNKLFTPFRRPRCAVTRRDDSDNLTFPLGASAAESTTLFALRRGTATKQSGADQTAQ